MLKRRIIAVVVVRDGIAVQSIGFRRYLPLGRPEIAVEFLDRWGVDEIVLADISASRAGRGPDNEMVQRVARTCHVPLTVAGGINSTEHIACLLSNGADKVAINQAARTAPKLITQAAHLFGNQCIVASIDAAPDGDGVHRVHDYITETLVHDTPAQLAHRMQVAGAGEILLNSVNRDGSYCGFDVDLIRSVIDMVTIPVIAVGGAGSLMHFSEAFAVTGVSALAAGNIFHFWEHSVAVLKSSIDPAIPIRSETAFSYVDACTDPYGRLLKKPDETLQKMLYVRIETEVI